MTRSEMRSRVVAIRNELEFRHKHGIVKMSKKDGTPILAKDLQNELYSLIYKLSKFDYYH